MSNIFTQEIQSIDVRSTGTNYLLSLASRLTLDQKATFIKYYRNKGHASAASYALGHADMWAAGLIKPRPASMTRYMAVIRSVISPAQKMELLKLECDAFAQRLPCWSKAPNDPRLLTKFFSKALENPISVVPSFRGLSSEFFTKDQIDVNLLSNVANEVFNVAVVLSKVSLIQRCDDVIDLLRAPRIKLYLQHRFTGLVFDISERFPEGTWSETYKSFLPAAAFYNSAIDLHSIRLDAKESEARIGMFKALTENLSDRYCHDLAYSTAKRVSTSVENAEWILTCVAPYSSLAAVERDQRNHRWALLVTGNVLIYLMFTSWWLLVFIVAFAFAWMMSSHVNSGVHVRTIEILRKRLLVTREKTPVYPETNY